MNVRIIKLARLTALAATVAFFAGCKKNQSGTSSQNPSATASGGAIVSAEKTSFDEVTSKLDKGGNLYLYLSTEQVMAKLSSNLAAFSNVLTQLPATPGLSQANIGKLFEVVGRIITDSGVEHVSGVGASSIAREEHFYYNKLIVHHYAGQGDGLMWTMFGKEPHSLKELDLLPATTVFATYSDLDVPLFWKTLQKELRQLHNPQVDSALDQLPARFQEGAGMVLDDMLNSLGDGYGFLLTLDENTTVTLPIPGHPMDIPEPGLAIYLKVKNDAIYKRLEELAANNPLVSKSSEGGVKSMTFTLPIPMPFRLSPTFARTGDYLLITSSDKMLHDMLDVMSGKQKGFKSTDEFKKLSQGIPDEGNNYALISQKLGVTVKKAMKGVLSGQPALLGERGQTLQAMMDANPAAYSYSVGVNSSEGWAAYGNGNQSMGAVLLPATAVAAGGLLAAIAIPNFARARATSQENACINNLRLIDGAKQQWAIENKKSSTDTPTEQDLLPYLGKAPNATFPRCPQGGVYRIGAINEKPTCSIPGHVLP